jgi:hypothetical protein
MPLIAATQEIEVEELPSKAGPVKTKRTYSEKQVDVTDLTSVISTKLVPLQSSLVSR